jgi:hypothetical protein
MAARPANRPTHNRAGHRRRVLPRGQRHDLGVMKARKRHDALRTEQR